MLWVLEGFNSKILNTYRHWNRQTVSQTFKYTPPKNTSNSENESFIYIIYVLRNVNKLTPLNKNEDLKYHHLILKQKHTYIHTIRQPHNNKFLQDKDAYTINEMLVKFADSSFHFRITTF